MRVCVTGLRGLPGVMGGVETHCEELLPRVVALDPNASIRVIARRPYMSGAARLFEGVEVVPLHSPKRKSLEAIVSTVLGVIHARRHGWKVVHIHAIGPALVAPFARLLGLRVVMTHHGEDYNRAKWGPAAKAMLRMGEALGVYSSNRVIAVSPSLAEALKAKYPSAREKIRYIPNGVPALLATETSSEQPLAELGLNAKSYILAVGRLVPEKGFDYLVKAFKASGSPLDLVIAGGADHASEYSRELLAMGDERVHFIGLQPRSALRHLYENAALFVLPSFHEGLPIAALEAASCGAPMLLSDIQANKDIGLSDENYFATGDIAALSAALMRPVSTYALDPAKVRRAFDWDVIAQQTLDVYREVS